MSEHLPEEVARQVWARQWHGASCEEMSAWLGLIGYSVHPDEVAVIASRYEQQRDTAWADGGDWH
jgi:hypothetical protein